MDEVKFHKNGTEIHMLKKVTCSFPIQVSNACILRNSIYSFTAIPSAFILR